ncbi:helix-turn-helix transcriptional regulator [Kitasatospora sp. NA04385]|uniref:helix-turn-helix domain-containing protein n=1 Tax=Kitasatospora sp. NA04385 TaxID=2742135 RepID=UPI0015925CEC|nr:helix-turn-helix transcriptional regulator [Kitasatospora sp. NA04385]QKW22058.1 helix-turn-helix transcriptional regulator [Kitasatospora sp. NA04385]
MPAPTATHLGYRVAAARAAAGLTRREVHEASGVSVSMIRQVEAGTRTPSDAVLDVLARALRTTPEQLADGPGRTDSRVHRAIPVLQAAIASYDLPEDGPVRLLRNLGAAVEEMTVARVNSQYGRLVELIPALLEELFRAVHQAAEGPDRRQAGRLLALAVRSADAAAYKYGYRDLSARLVELMRWAAGIAEDPALDAAAAYVRTEVHFATGQLGAGLRALQQAADRMPAPTTVPLAAAAVALHMRAAVVAGRAVDAGSARLHLAEAERLVRGVPEQLYDGTAVGPASVRIHQLAVAVELGDSADLGRAVAEAGHWVPPRDLPAERRSHYYIDLGRAQIALGRPRHARESLLLARRIAPQHVREHGQVRTELATLVRLTRGRDEELLSMARWAKAV